MKTFLLFAGTVSLLFTGNVRAEQPKSSKSPDEGSWKQLIELLDVADFAQRLQEAEARRRVTNNLKQIAESLRNYQGSPALPGYSDQSWMMHILPYIEQGNVFSYYSTGFDNRLGAVCEPINAAMRSQLDLANDKGVIVTKVTPESAAANAGLREHDILLRWDGKEVTADFAKLFEAWPAKKATPIVVLRKGKEVTLKDIVLPEARLVSPKIYVCPSDGTSNTITTGDKYWGYQSNYALLNGWGGTVPSVPSKVLTTTHRLDDRFTARYEEGSLVITLTGTMKNERGNVSQVKVIDSSKEYRFESLDKTAEEYRDKARDLLKAAEKNQDRVQIQK